MYKHLYHNESYTFNVTKNIRGDNMSTRDDMVLEVQVWLNETYGEEIIEAMGSSIEENGKTSWEVTNGLLIGLQVELGVPTPAPSFGPTTEAYLDAYGSISEGNNDANANINQIIQGGCYATGYNPYGFNGIFDENLTNAIKELEDNIGLTKSGIVDTKLMKALLTMNAYVLLAGGSDGVRYFQQWLNGTYRNKDSFDYIPCDGLYSRTTQEGIVYGIQYECDLDAVANGSFGPTTKANLKEKGLVYIGDNDDDTGKNFVHLFRGSFLCNNTDSTLLFNGIFDSHLEIEVEEFQSFTAINVNGEGNYETWCELLVSTGDETRATTALDCSVEKVSVERAELFKASGYKYIGRYIIEIDGGLDKALEQYEIDNIFSNGMSIIPLFQMGGSYSDYFTHAMGVEDAEIAYKNARSIYGIPKRTIIYFAVDYDAYEYEASEGIYDYFKAIYDYFKDDCNMYYRVGIYASRNICQILYDLGVVNSAYVSGMSTGYSGNLGYSLPVNWTFNQINEDFELGIDNVVANDKDKGFNTQLFTTEDTNKNLYENVKMIYELAVEFKPGQSVEYYNNAVMDYYRVEKYGGPVWIGVDGGLNQEFLDYVASQGVDSYDPEKKNIDLETDYELDFSHMIATCQGYYNHTEFVLTQPRVGDIGGWCGDFISLCGNYYSQTEYASIEEYMTEKCLVNDFVTDHDTYYGLADHIADIDGFFIAKKLLGDTNLKIYEALKSFYYDDYTSISQRCKEFYEVRSNGDTESLLELNQNSILPNTDDFTTTAYIEGLFIEYSSKPLAIISEDEKLLFAELYTQKELNLF